MCSDSIACTGTDVECSASSLCACATGNTAHNGACVDDGKCENL